MNGPWNTRTVALPGGDTLHVVDEGSGFPLLLIHGLAGDHRAWAPQIDAWRGSHRIIAPDTRGAGGSTQRDEPVTLQALADDFLHLLDALDIGRCHLLGRSMGGSIGQLMVLAQPERFASLTLLASCAKFEAVGRRCLDNMREVLQWRGNWADHARHSVQNFVSRRFFNAHPDRVAAIESIIGAPGRLMGCYVQQNLAVQQHDVLDRLHHIGCPVLVMSGAEDPLCGPEATRWMLERLPHAQWVEFEGASHFFLLEQPERFMREAEAFLAAHTAA